MDERNPVIGFIGAGVLGKGLALSLSAKGYRVEAIFSRSVDSARWLADRVPGCRAVGSAQELTDTSDLVFITTPDSVINEVADGLVWRPGQGVAHCCGAASTEILQPASDQGAVAGWPIPPTRYPGCRGSPSPLLAMVGWAIFSGSWPRTWVANLFLSPTPTALCITPLRC